VGKNRLPVAVLPLAKLEVQGREALRPRALLCGRHFQALGASCRASDEGEEQRVGAPGEESPRRLGTEDLGQEEDALALGFVETALIIAHSPISPGAMRYKSPASIRHSRSPNHIELPPRSM
jgi:hypothetical protein